MTKQRNIRALLPLFLVVFVDAIGMGIIIPILTPLMFSPAGMLTAHASPFIREFFYGITLAIFPLSMFFSLPILGELSDEIGRKKIIIFCLSGIAISYFLSVTAVWFNSVSLLILSRSLAGLCSGSVATAQAAIIDVCPAKEKTRYLSLLLFPVALGYIAGPVLSALISNQRLISWFGLWTPLLFAGLLATVNLGLLLCSFHETHHTKQGKISLNLHRAIHLFIDAFRNANIRLLSSVFLLFQISWALYFQYISLFMLHKFNYDSNDLGYLMAFLAVGFAVAFLYLIPLLSRYYTNLALLKASLIVCAGATLVSALSPFANLIWLSTFVAAVSDAVAYSTSISLFSDAVDETQQGWIMGITAAVYSLAFAFTAVASIFLAMISANVPLLCAFIAMLGAAIFSFKLKHYSFHLVGNT